MKHLISCTKIDELLYPIFVTINEHCERDGELVVSFDDTEFYAEQVHNHFENDGHALSYEFAMAVAEEMRTLDAN